METDKQKDRAFPSLTSFWSSSLTEHPKPQLQGMGHPLHLLLPSPKGRAVHRTLRLWWTRPTPRQTAENSFIKRWSLHFKVTIFPDAGKDGGQEEKGAAEDEMVGWHHRLNGHKFKQTLGNSEGQGHVVRYSPWDRSESDMTEPLSHNKKWQKGRRKITEWLWSFAVPQIPISLRSWVSAACTKEDTHPKIYQFPQKE